MSKTAKPSKTLKTREAQMHMGMHKFTNSKENNFLVMGNYDGDGSISISDLFF